MPTNVYFNNFENKSEQNLIHDLIIESIKMYGMDVYWLPRRSSDKSDSIFGEDTLESYAQAFLLEMYIKNVEGFEGEGEFLSKFGLDIRDQITFTTSIRRFELIDPAEIDPVSSNPVPYVRPREGDLIYFPLNGKLFQIQFVEHESLFYTAGTLPVYDLRCELFAYNNQVITTGIEEIDAIATAYAHGNTMLGTASTTTDNEAIEAKANTILDFSETNPFGNF